MVAMVEVTISPELSPYLLSCFGATAASVVGLMVITMLNCTLMLVAILVIIALIRSRRGTLDYSFDEELASNPDVEERDEVDELLDSIDV